ncbi:MAG: hypothetical protein LBU69_01130, partial [Deltaproteobacteria bacterium]|nr:hypothetical protein [Deltaproteobacteria bacterium]
TASSHPADDGLELSRTDATGASADEWTPAQSQIMVAGRKYAFRAKAAGDPAAVAKAYVNAWITGLTSGGTAQATFNQALLGGGSCTPVPDAAGYVYCTYTAPSTLPAGGVAPVFARARVSLEAGATPTSRGPANAAQAHNDREGRVRRRGSPVLHVHR